MLRLYSAILCNVSSTLEDRLQQTYNEVVQKSITSRQKARSVSLSNISKTGSQWWTWSALLGQNKANFFSYIGPVLYRVSPAYST